MKYIREEKRPAYTLETVVDETTYRQRAFWVWDGREVEIYRIKTTLKEMGWSCLREFLREKGKHFRRSRDNG